MPHSPRETVVGAVGLVAVCVFGLGGGWAMVAVVAGIYVLGTGLWTVALGVSWVGAVGRRAGAIVAVVGVALILAGGAGAAGSSSDAAPAQPAPSPRDAEPDPAPSTDLDAAAAAAQPGSALAAVAALEVKGRAPKTGYDRDLFGDGWVDVDRNGCDTRNDILGRDLDPRTVKAGTHDCVVLAGVLADPYSGTTIAFTRGQGTSEAVQIDHVVALSDAWQKGAQQWDDATRVAFANDPRNLLAVDGPLNEQKSDGDAATWLPPNTAYRCAYVARQVGVKVTYGLWVTAAERDAMVAILSGCPAQPLPDGVLAPTVAPTTSSTTSPAPAPPVVAEPQPVPPAPQPPAATSAGCDPSYPGVCIPPGPPDLDCADVPYRKFVVTGADPHGFDGNHDGVGCEG